jgi:peptidase M23-like protein
VKSRYFFAPALVLAALVGVTTSPSRASDAGHHLRAASATSCAGTEGVRLLSVEGIELGTLTSRRFSGGNRVPWSYDWPIRPFLRQHPIRGFFDDPRVNGHTHAFHFGVDIAAPDGTPVYAIAPGKVYHDEPRAIGIVEAGGRALSYWHIIPAVPGHVHVRRHQLIGHIAPHWGHVHLSEWDGHAYVNPLRPGGLGPYRDRVAPTVAEVGFLPRGGRFDLVASAFDMPSPRVPGAWANEPVTPVLIRWRLVKEGHAVIPWQTTSDFRTRLLPPSSYGSVYTSETRQNHAGEPGLYCFFLKKDWDVQELTVGGYAVQVRAEDTRGNRAVATLPLHVNASSRRISLR